MVHLSARLEKLSDRGRHHTLRFVGAVVGLWALDQTINIMTLGDSLAVGVLVDRATVVIEYPCAPSIGLKARAVVEASKGTAFPLLLAMRILAVFLPSFS
jgi:multidrug efflux pump subunit AcrB